MNTHSIKVAKQKLLRINPQSETILRRIQSALYANEYSNCISLVSQERLNLGLSIQPTIAELHLARHTKVGGQLLTYSCIHPGGHFTRKHIYTTHPHLYRYIYVSSMRIRMWIPLDRNLSPSAKNTIRRGGHAKTPRFVRFAPIFRCAKKTLANADTARIALLGNSLNAPHIAFNSTLVNSGLTTVTGVL